MSERPRRIWLQIGWAHGKVPYVQNATNIEKPAIQGGIEYIRADIAEARIEAARRQCREEAAAELERIIADMESWQWVAKGALKNAAAAILALNAPKSEPPAINS